MVRKNAHPKEGIFHIPGYRGKVGQEIERRLQHDKLLVRMSPLGQMNTRRLCLLQDVMLVHVITGHGKLN